MRIFIVLCFLLQVNGVDIREFSHQRVLQVLRQTTSPILRLLVHRGEGYSEDEMSETTTVELVKRPGKGLGISIVERGIGAGILIADIVRNLLCSFNIHPVSFGF